MTSRFGALALALAFSFSLKATELINNGGFETGDLSGWTVASTGGSDDAWFANNSTVTNLNGYLTVGPASGNWYAVTDGSGLVSPESTALYQTVAIPVGTTDDLLSLDIFVNDWNGGSGPGAEVAIWASGANPLTASPIDVIYTADTATIAGLPNPYIAISQDITAFLTPGSSYEIGILETDITGPINVGVDNVSLAATSGAGGVPEPGMLIPTGLLAAGMLFYRARRKASAKV